MSDAVPTLLLVDDEERILTALRRALRREGYRLLLAASAEEAIAKLEHERVDVLVSDQRMPGGDGLALLREASRRWPEVGRILLTGWSDHETANALDAIGDCALVGKPWDDRELKELLRKTVAGRRARA